MSDKSHAQNTQYTMKSSRLDPFDYYVPINAIVLLAISAIM